MFPWCLAQANTPRGPLLSSLFSLVCFTASSSYFVVVVVVSRLVLGPLVRTLRRLVLVVVVVLVAFPVVD
jgi:hypothetical protein